MSTDRMAFEDPDFMNSRDARGLRILAEYDRAARLMKQYGIENTIVFFCSARSKPEAVAQLELGAVEQSLQNPIDDADRIRLERLLQVAQQRVRLGRYHDECSELARRLAEWGMQNNTHKIYHLCSGGGPGIMEAANRGAYDAGGRSVGINIYLRTQERQNPYLNERIGFKYFFVRKLILAHIAQAYVYFPGGFGTLDEFFEISTLVATKKIEQKMPIVLIGKTYWNSLQRFLEKTAVEKYETLAKEKVRIWDVTDSITEAFEIVRKIPRRIIRSEDV